MWHCDGYDKLKQLELQYMDVWTGVNWECAAKRSSYMQYPQFVVTQGELCGYGLQCQTIVQPTYQRTSPSVYRLSEVFYVDRW